MILNSRGLLGAGLGKNSSAQASSAVVYLPPGSPLHWYDFTDTSVMFTDEAGTTNVSSDTEMILRINNKGSSTEIISTEVEGPLYATTGIPTTTADGVAYFDSTAAIKTTLTDIASHEHYTCAVVYSTEAIETFAAVASWDEFSATFATGGDDTTRWYTINTEPVTGTAAMVNDTFYGYIAVNDDELSPEASVLYQGHSETVTNADTELTNAVATGDTFGFGERSTDENSPFSGHIIEWLCWDAILTAEEITAYQTYVTDKYGVAWV
jgi:hypothetical protein